MKISQQDVHDEKLYEKESESLLIFNAERKFQKACSEDFLNLMVILLSSDDETISAYNQNNNISVSNEVCVCLSVLIKKTNIVNDAAVHMSKTFTCHI